MKNYDVLLLDEPTNHLDLLTREALIKAMQDYEGCLIFVSHDRYFIDSVSNKILYISKTIPHYHEGNYESFKEYEKLLLDQTEDKSKKIKKEKPKRVKKPTEEDLLKIEKEIAFIKEEEFKEENYMDSNKMKVLEERLKQLEQEYDELFLEIYGEE